MLCAEDKINNQSFSRSFDGKIHDFEKYVNYNMETNFHILYIAPNVLNSNSKEDGIMRHKNCVNQMLLLPEAGEPIVRMFVQCPVDI